MSTLTRACICLALACLLPGCGALDFFGWETTVEESAHKKKPAKIEDDKIEDKHPKYVKDLTTTEEFGTCAVTMNKTKTVTKLDVLEPEGTDAELKDRLFKSREEAIEWVSTTHGASFLLPSIESVNGALKPFNDGLYAAVEIGMQQGIEAAWKGKLDFLERLLQAIQTREATCAGDACAAFSDAAVQIAAGLLLGGSDVELPGDLHDAANAQISAFDASGLYSRPIGFYTWNETLERVFRQDRFLQNALAELDGGASFGAFAAMASVIQADEELAADYDKILGLYAVLTNPYTHYPVTELYPYVKADDPLDDLDGPSAKFLNDHEDFGGDCGKHLALVPSSRSKESDLFTEMYCDISSPPEGTNLIDLFIDKIRSGEVDLEPSKDSGWYDYQTYALETLLLPERGPESDHLLLTKAYKEKLVETFKTIITQNRETHVKQLSFGGMGSSAGEPPEPIEVDVYPKFPAEPFPTFYLRSARAYRFLSVALEGMLGAEFLAATHRLNEDQTSAEASLSQGLHDMAGLLYGLYLLNCDSLGMKRDLLDEELAEYPEEECVAAAEEWLAGWTANPDVLSDPRVVVPVARDFGVGTVVYWAVIGVRVLPIKAEFVEGYTPEILSVDPVEGSDDGCVFRDFVPRTSYLLMEKMTEFSLPEGVDPPTRDEFRAACDAWDTETEIVDALGGTL